MNKKTPATPLPSAPARHPVVVWLTDGACWFTVLCLFLLLLNVTVWPSNGVPPLRYLLLFPMALCFSTAATVRRSSISRGIRYALHPVLVVGGIYLFGFLPYQIDSQAPSSTVMIMAVLVLALYGLGVGATALILRKKHVKATEKQPYDRQFRNDRP